MSSRPKKGRRACDQTYRRQARREKAMLRRQKDTAIYGRILTDKDAPKDVREEAEDKHTKAVYEVGQLIKKLTNYVVAKQT